MPHLGRYYRALSPADRRLIEQEHARLNQFVQDLRETCVEFNTWNDCQGCSRERIAACQGRLTSFLYDFLDLVAEHFENEEKIMSGSLRFPEADNYLRLHRAEHARLIGEVRELMRLSTELSNRGDTAAAIRLLDQGISEMFGEHARDFDNSLLRPEQKSA